MVRTHRQMRLSRPNRHQWWASAPRPRHLRLRGRSWSQRRAGARWLRAVQVAAIAGRWRDDLDLMLFVWFQSNRQRRCGDHIVISATHTADHVWRCRQAASTSRMRRHQPTARTHDQSAGMRTAATSPAGGRASPDSHHGGRLTIVPVTTRQQLCALAAAPVAKPSPTDEVPKLRLINRNISGADSLVFWCGNERHFLM